jgi:hypothetical protein
MTVLTNSLPQTETRSKSRPEMHFADGYRVRVVKNGGRVVVGLFDIRKADGTVYRVNQKHQTCSCQSTKICKHLLDLQELVIKQASYWGRKMDTEPDLARNRRFDDLSQNLHAAQDRFWGIGEMAFVGEFEIFQGATA